MKSLLTAPEHIDVDEFLSQQEKEEAKQSNTFTRYFDDKLYAIGTNEGRFFSCIKLSAELYDILDQNTDSQVQKKTLSQGELPIALTYGVIPEKFLNTESEENSNQSGIEKNYYVETLEPLKIPKSKNLPISIDDNQLAEIVKNKKVLRYTGAGISIDQIPGMADLKNALGIKKEMKFDPFLINSIHSPKTVENAWLKFHQQMHNTQPTNAHWAIKKLSEYAQTTLLTENVDPLHQKTGVAAIIPNGKNFTTEFNIDDLDNIDVIITVGLSHDDRALLASFKAHNPSGIICAINISIPDYLSEQDQRFQGDCQEILPKLATMIIAK